MTIDLPWPSPKLSPNARGHWAIVHRAKATARMQAKVITMAAMMAAQWQPPSDGTIPLTITFCPPNKRDRDMDNALASLKAALDGVADALGVDDKRFVLTLQWGEPCKHGRVMVTL